MCFASVALKKNSGSPNSLRPPGQPFYLLSRCLKYSSALCISDLTSSRCGAPHYFYITSAASFSIDFCKALGDFICDAFLNIGWSELEWLLESKSSSFWVCFLLLASFLSFSRLVLARWSVGGNPFLISSTYLMVS